MGAVVLLHQENPPTWAGVEHATLGMRKEGFVPDTFRSRGEAAQTVATPDLMTRKVLLCIWWYWKGIIYFELLPYGQTINSYLYCQQLDRLKLAIDQKRPELANREVLCSTRTTPGHTSL
ncbi:putative DD34D transposase [Trichonephila clavipes]|nr:putative DD34D transposase [Trichonephila clavipes]